MNEPIKIETRRDFELHVKSQVANMQVSNKVKAVVRKAIMEGFDSGMDFARQNLKVNK